MSMAGTKLGDRLLQLGAGDGGMFAALASKVGLTGRACLIDHDPQGITRAQRAAAKEGVLVETALTRFPSVPYDNEAFDLVVVHQLLSRLPPYERIGTIRECYRVLRAGGRCLIIEQAVGLGLAAMLPGPSGDRQYLRSGGPELSLKAEGFKAPRKLAERSGLVFYEGVKGRD
jgi:SAM-dependent methyltransferase